MLLILLSNWELRIQPRVHQTRIGRSRSFGPSADKSRLRTKAIVIYVEDIVKVLGKMARSGQTSACASINSFIAPASRYKFSSRPSWQYPPPPPPADSPNPTSPPGVRGPTLKEEEAEGYGSSREGEKKGERADVDVCKDSSCLPAR
jgi:hypothetical protein